LSLTDLARQTRIMRTCCAGIPQADRFPRCGVQYQGVDLNRNYPASWEEAKAQEEALGIFGPGPTRYGGPYPLSEPESSAMVSFTRTHDSGLPWHTIRREE